MHLQKCALREIDPCPESCILTVKPELETVQSMRGTVSPGEFKSTEMKSEGKIEN